MRQRLVERARGPASARRGVVAAGATALCVTTSGPSIFASQHIFHVAPVWTTWTFAYPFTLVAVGGGVLAVKILRDRARARAVPWPLYPIGALLALAALSATWSVAPATTPAAVLLDIGIVLAGVWFGLAPSVPEQVWSAAIAAAVPVVASLPVIAWRPSYGRTPVPYVGASYGGDWIGIFANRNSLAAVSVFGLVAAAGLVVVVKGRLGIVAGVVLGATCAVVVWFTNSDTALITVALVALAGVGVPLLGLLRRWRVPGVAVVVTSAVAGLVGWHVLFANLDRLAAWAGRDPTLSNRRTIWRDVRGFIAARPWRGYGYWAIWDEPTRLVDTYARVGKQYGSAHNSALELLLGLGVLGLVLYLVIAIASLLGTARWAWTSGGAASWWWCLVAVYVMAENLTESFVLWHSYNLVLWVATALVPFSLTAARHVGLVPETPRTVASPAEGEHHP